MAYRDDELRAMLAFAVGVYSDAKASPADRAAALARLERDTRPLDLSKLSTEQLVALTNAMRTTHALLQVARGDAFKAPMQTPPLWTPELRSAPTRELVNPTSAPAAEPEPVPVPDPPAAPKPKLWRLTDLMPRRSIAR